MGEKRKVCLIKDAQGAANLFIQPVTFVATIAKPRHKTGKEIKGRKKHSFCLFSSRPNSKGLPLLPKRSMGWIQWVSQSQMIISVLSSKN